MAHDPQPRLDTRGTDRAAGVLLGAAVGDALGVPYEFQTTLRDDQQPQTAAAWDRTRPASTPTTLRVRFVL